ncbi:YppG family protein [Thalassobacillus hwangdonensis]|uniref:YppG family protein n=1 Tax=Thalassobacillus hwangdonensis TaxID=546108 RepID=A0ABW3KZN5_9BACI
MYPFDYRPEMPFNQNFPPFEQMQQPFFPQQPQQWEGMEWGMNPQVGNDFNTQQAPPNPPSTPFEIYAKPPYEPPQDAFGGYGQNQQFYGGAPKPGMLSMFQDKNGQLDMEKMMSTVGQMANTVNQLSPLMKGIGGLFKGFR